MAAPAATPILVLAERSDPLVASGRSMEDGPNLRPGQGSAAPLAECAAGELFARELDRYLRGRIPGLSVLVAGHRGSGKTTLVRATVDRAVRQSRGEGSVRPLPVLLNGPDLLPNPAAPADPTQADAAATKETQATQRVLIQITIALYRALAQEMSRAYRERLGAVPGPPWAMAEGAELAAQLELELDDAPDPPLLRDYWARGGFLETGVLFWPKQRPPGQGMHELVGLATAAQAYRVVSGAYDTVRKLQANDELARSRSSEASGGIGKDVLPTGLGLITAAVTGGGFLLDGVATGLGAGAAALVAGLAGTWTFKASASRSRKRAVSREYTFIRNNSVSTLERELPILVDRIRAAGLAPVFVVDELDKVVELPERMGTLVQHLKQFVTERTFFCFLTDRYYFEHVDVASEANPYPRAHTYFSHRLFVTYRPQELRQYVAELLEPNTPAGTERERAELDREALSFVLVFGARAHPFDLRGALAGIADSQGGVRLTPGAVRTQLGYRYQIAVQFAIEHLLEADDMRHRLDEDPYFGQIAYDTLYYPARLWAQGKAVDARKEGLERHLSERIRLNREESRVGTRSPVGDGNQNPAEPRQRDAVRDVLGEDDREFLYRQLTRLIALLADPDELVQELTRHGRLGVSTQLIRAVPVRRAGLRDPRLLEEDPAHPGVYHWRFDPFGRALVGQPPRQVSDADIRADIAFTRQIDDFMRSLTSGAYGLDDLALRVGVLEPTPDWREVEAAAARIESFDTGAAIVEYDQLVDDTIAVDEYARMLERHGERLARALLLANELGSRPHIMGPIALLDGLNAMAEVLNLGAEPDSAQIDSLLLELAGTPVPVDGVQLSGPSGRPGTPRLERDTVGAWQEQVRLLLDAATFEPPTDPVEREAVRMWRSRMDAFLAGERSRFTPTRLDLLYRASGADLSYLLRPDLDAMTAAAWGHVLESLFVDRGGGERPPLWLLVPALATLGLGAAIPGVLDAIQRQETPFLAPPEWLGEEAEQARDWGNRHHRRLGWTVPRAAGLVLFESPSFTSEWRPSGTFGALVADLVWFDDRLLAWLVETLHAASPFQALFWHFPAGAGASTRAMALLDQLQGALRVPAFELGNLQTGPPGSRFLGEPDTLDEAMNRALRLMPDEVGGEQVAAP